MILMQATPFFENLIPLTRPVVYTIEQKKKNEDDKTVQANNVAGSENRIVTQDLKFFVTDLKDSYELSIELPGVKLSDIKIDVVNDSFLSLAAERRSSNRSTIMYEKKFAIDTKEVDVSTALAELDLGILSIRMTKKQPEEPLMIAVTKDDPAIETKHDDQTVLQSIDLPGVKLEDIQVKYFEGKIHVDAKRVRPNKEILKILKSFKVDLKKYDESKLSSFLGDGVLTVYGSERDGTIEKVEDDTTGSSTDNKIKVRSIQIITPNE